MIGLDTNVLLRLFVEDDPAQSASARLVSAATADEPCIVNPLCSPSSLGRLPETLR